MVCEVFGVQVTSLKKCEAELKPSAIWGVRQALFTAIKSIAYISAANAMCAHAQHLSGPARPRVERHRNPPDVPAAERARARQLPTATPLRNSQRDMGRLILESAECPRWWLRTRPTRVYLHSFGSAAPHGDVGLPQCFLNVFDVPFPPSSSRCIDCCVAYRFHKCIMSPLSLRLCL